jgi:hypothetical protein
MVAKHPDNFVAIPPQDDIMELSFMISRLQFTALEQAAQTAQMSVAQYLRRLVQFNIREVPHTMTETE